MKEVRTRQDPSDTNPDCVWVESDWHQGFRPAWISAQLASWHSYLSKENLAHTKIKIAIEKIQTADLLYNLAWQGYIVPSERTKQRTTVSGRKR